VGCYPKLFGISLAALPFPVWFLFLVSGNIGSMKHCLATGLMVDPPIFYTVVHGRVMVHQLWLTCHEAKIVCQLSLWFNENILILGQIKK